MSTSSGRVKTRILIISDTHNVKPKPSQPPNPDDSEDDFYLPANIHEFTTGYRDPLPTADVAIHCGDLSMNSYTAQLKATFDMLRAIPAPLKIVMAGNHDLMLDDEYWSREEVDDVRYNRKKMWQIIKDAEADGVKYITEGTYAFDLQNGARLSLYASPYTPKYGNWAFQYEEDHHFEIPKQVDIAMTHGPPKRVADLCRSGDRAGCMHLFEAVRQARPRIHCFGHIHEGWGAWLAKWKDSRQGAGVEEAVDAEASKWVLSMSDQNRVVDGSGSVVEEDEIERLSEQRGAIVDTTEGEFELHDGEDTLFVNAAIMSHRYRPTQLPWIVDINLQRTTDPEEQKTVQKTGGGFSMPWLK